MRFDWRFVSYFLLSFTENFFDLMSGLEFLGSGFFCAFSRERTFAVVWRVREERQVTITFSPEGRHGTVGLVYCWAALSLLGWGSCVPSLALLGFWWGFSSL